jgi:hypothetical protein
LTPLLLLPPLFSFFFLCSLSFFLFLFQQQLSKPSLILDYEKEHGIASSLSSFSSSSAAVEETIKLPSPEGKEATETTEEAKEE